MRLLFTLLLLALASPAFALEPKDVWLVVNKNVPESRQVADHYIAKRGVPQPGQQGVVPEPVEEGRVRDARPGGGAVHDRVPEAGGVLRPVGDRRVHAGGVLRPLDAVL